MSVGSGRYPSGQRGQTVNLLANAFGGSNPPLPTTLAIEAWPGSSVGGVPWAGPGFVAHADVLDLARPGRAECGLSRAARAFTGGNSSAVERQPSKLGVAGSNPVSRSRVVGDRGAPQVSRGAPSVWPGEFEGDVAPFARMVGAMSGPHEIDRIRPCSSDGRARPW